MALSPAFVVHVDKPAEILLSQYFVEMRIWLDAHEITPTDFRLFGGPIVGLEVRFRSPEQAALFEREFGPKDQPTTVIPLIFANLAPSQASEALSSHNPAASELSAPFAQRAPSE
jgi:hypothetical protein